MSARASDERARPLAVASLGAFVAALSTSLVAVSTPVMAAELSVTPRDVSWVLTAYLLTISALLALAGKAADVLGRKRVYLAGLVFFIAGSATCAASLDLATLVSGRVVQGVGAAMLMAVGPAIVTRAAPAPRRARALGVQLAATYLGLMLGPSLGGALATRLAWTSIFVVIAGAGSIGLVLAIAMLPPDDEPRHRPSVRSLDLPGAALFAVGLSALLVALKRAQDGAASGPTWLIVALVALAALALGAFARRAGRHPSPLFPLRLFKEAPFTFGVLGATLLYTVTFMLAYLLPFQLQREVGLSAARAGAIMTAQPATMAVVAPLSGAFADRWGPRAPSVAGMLAIACGMAAIASTAQAPGAPLVLSLAVVGAGAGLYVAPNSALVMGAAPRDRQSTAAAMAATARNVGMTLGIAIAASLEHAVDRKSVV